MEHDCRRDPEEDLLIPLFDYPEKTEGILFRISDALELAGFFMKGLELGGIAPKDIPDELRKEAELLAETTAILYRYNELIEKGKKLSKKEIRASMQVIGSGESAIDRCIANIYAGLRNNI